MYITEVGMLFLHACAEAMGASPQRSHAQAQALGFGVSVLLGLHSVERSLYSVYLRSDAVMGVVSTDFTHLGNVFDGVRSALITEFLQDAAINCVSSTIAGASPLCS